ncbi:MAG: DNA polymerase III subunit gamma/tau [Bacteroidia bacterium]|nr:DNA polymerase III subunit gamma/tau [Bacteroidia bacterium]
MDQYIVSARKYRPATFDMVVGQSAITSTLKNAIRNNTLAQAFLFTGPRGVGKTTCARILAKTINCLNPTPNQEACDQCESCVSFRQSASFNIHELDAASNNSVDDIRNLVDQVRIPPQVGRYKVYIIDEVHMLSQAAFNAFLKTLEEPPSYAKFILATTEKHKIIPTILSRCQIYDFKRITVDDMSKHLAYVAEKEGVNIDEDARNIIALKADGALRDALSIFDQMVSFSGRNITYHDVISNLNVLDFEFYFKMVDYLLQRNISGILLMLNEVVYNGFDPQHFMIGLASHLRNLLVAAQPETAQLLEVSETLRSRYRQQSAQCSPAFLLSALEISNECDVNYARSSNKRLLVELSLLRMAAAGGNNADTRAASMPLINPNQSQSSPQLSSNQSKPADPIATAAAQTVHSKPSASAPKPATPPAPSYTTPETNSTANEPQPARPGGARTISITQQLSKPVKETTGKPVANAPFTQEALDRAWFGFCDSYAAQSPSYANAIRRLKPVLEENWTIKIKMDNKYPVSDKLNWNALQDFLFNQLNNNQLQLIPVFVDTPVAQAQPFTDKEKFQKLQDDYPFLRQLRIDLELEPES